MSTLKAFSSTTVSLSKTQDEVEKLLAKHGVMVSRWTHFAEVDKVPGKVRFEFEWHRNKDSPPLGFRFEVGYQRVEGPRGGNAGTTREQAGRALFWHVKNLFDAVDWGIVDMEQAFLPYLLGPGDVTVYEAALPKFHELATSTVPLLTEGR